MYDITVEEYEMLQKVVSYEMKGYMKVYKCDRDEFLSMGNFAIGKACATYDESKGVAFKTYAAKCIRNEFGLYNRREKSKIGTKSSLDYEISNDKGDSITYLNKLESNLTNYDIITDMLALEESMKSILSERDYNIINLTMRGYSQGEIGRILEINPKYITHYKQRAYKKLRAELEVEECLELMD